MSAWILLQIYHDPENMMQSSLLSIKDVVRQQNLSCVQKQ
jgi:hypothetical protein